MVFLKHGAAALGIALMMFCAPSMSASTPDVAANTPRNLRIMTFNVRYPSPDDGINTWPHRRELMVKVIREQHPDILGTQELLMRQANYLAPRLKNYKWFGLGRNGNNKDIHDNEHMGVFYNTTRLRTIKRGNFWLSKTPNVPGSNTWKEPFPRMVTWAEFQDKATGKRFYYFNTHFPYKTSAENLRERDARIILRRLARIPDALPIILAGDFNSTPDKPTHAILTKVLHDARASAAVHNGPARTFHGFTGKPTQQIDWILYRGLKVKDITTVTTHDGKVYPSDHFPVVADFVWPTAQ